ncbi:uncharacterized protein cubi_02556 [Cryptosporidium ubiquitum]|uniref:Uncharacterized protein n=1 Tax=Cryptosporidium ubiquitum TaxID=857276 RepID=A0A1J4MGL2_9CRYT|nr:uncharacterized protein cubi_02556 [Cryptosporidium ubiquitum]OII73344.1 hypothetical protein cubi_02556 [Cryptosporidium ubiquitum]
MSTYSVFELGKLDEKDFSEIAWLNNALRRRNVTENGRQLEEELLAISQSCMYAITDYNEQIESNMNEIGSLMSNFISKNEENNRICKELNSKISEFSNIVNLNEEKYISNINIENILSLFEKKEKLETVSQILTNNSKFESLLCEIESVLQDKDTFIMLIKGQGQDFHDIINKVCSLRVLVSSLESIPEFSARIERYKSLENSILNILDDFFKNKFINENIEENNIHELILVYSKFGHDSRLYKKMMDIINEQIEQVWKLLWSLTTFGSQNRGLEVEQFKKSSKKPYNNSEKHSSIIFLPAIMDLESAHISQDIFRIREDEAIIRFFSWFSELIFSKNHIITPILTTSNSNITISDTIQSIIKKLLCICIQDVKEFIEIIVNSITSSKFIFPENNSESFDMESDSIFEMDHDTISTIDVKEIRTICERIYKSIISGLELVIIPDSNKQEASNFVSSHLNQDHFTQISDMILIQGNFVQSLLLCDVAWIFQSIKNISSNLKSLIINQSPVSEYSLEIESKSSILADRIGTLLSNERFGDHTQLILIPLENYIIFFISIIDYSLRFFLENDLIYLLNPIQSSVRAQTLNLIKSIEKKQKDSNLLSSVNLLDKELLSSCFAFHFSLMKTRNTFYDLLQTLIIRCRSIYCSSAKNDDYESKSFLSQIFYDKICFNQYSIFQRIQETLSDSLSSEIKAILKNQELSLDQLDLLDQFGSQQLISQILSDSIDIISQCCSYPTLAFFEGYNRLDCWSKEDINIIKLIHNLKDSNLQSFEEAIISIIENSGIQPCSSIVSIGEYLLNIAVTLESTCNNNPDIQSQIESENLIPELVKKVSYIVEDTYRRQIFEIEYLSMQGCLQLYVDSKYILNIFEILLLYHKSPESDDSQKKLQVENGNQYHEEYNIEVSGGNDIVPLNSALLMIISNTCLESSSNKSVVNWYNSLKQKINNTEQKLLKNK